jgi:formiminoglutamase
LRDPQWPTAGDWLARGPSSGQARLGVVGVPLALTSISPSRADTTPTAVRLALGRFGTFHSGLHVDLENLTVEDHGDLDVAALLGDDALRSVTQAIGALPRHDLLVLLGGDNAVTRPSMRALLPDLGRAGLLTLDAHHDVRSFYMGPTNGTPVRGLVEDGLPGEQVIQIGIGEWSNSRAYTAWCLEHGVRSVTAGAAQREGVPACVRRCLNELALTCGDVYVDLDIDVLDRAFAPACPGARAGGLTPAELLDAALEAGRHGSVRAVDIVEVDARADVRGETVDIAAMCMLSVAAGLLTRPLARPMPSTGGHHDA